MRGAAYEERPVVIVERLLPVVQNIADQPGQMEGQGLRPQVWQIAEQLRRGEVSLDGLAASRFLGTVFHQSTAEELVRAQTLAILFRRRAQLEQLDSIRAANGQVAVRRHRYCVFPALLRERRYMF